MLSAHFGVSVSTFRKIIKDYPEVKLAIEHLIKFPTDRICRACKTEKPIGEYMADPVRKGGHRRECKECQKKYHQKIYIDNKRLIDSKNRSWYEENKTSRSLSIKAYRQKNGRKFYYKKRERMISDPIFSLQVRLRDRITKAFLAKEWKKDFGSSILLGTDCATAKIFIERKFQKGMSWENQGEWHIDHIIPLSSAKTKEELYELCHYTNLQPLWAIDNCKKGNMIPSVQRILAI